MNILLVEKVIDRVTVIILHQILEFNNRDLDEKSFTLLKRLLLDYEVSKANLRFLVNMMKNEVICSDRKVVIVYVKGSLGVHVCFPVQNGHPHLSMDSRPRPIDPLTKLEPFLVRIPSS